MKVYTARFGQMETIATAKPLGESWLIGGLLVGLFLAILLAGLLYLRQASVIATGGYDIEQLQAQHERLVIENKQLTHRLNNLSSQTRVESVASKRLQMGPPEEPLFLRAY